MALAKLDTPPRLRLIPKPTRTDHLRRAEAYRVIRLDKISRGPLLDAYASEEHPTWPGVAWLEGPAHQAWTLAFRAYCRAYQEFVDRWDQQPPATVWGVQHGK